MRLALAPLNPTVGDLTANADLAINAIVAAQDAGADLVVLPELVLSGYPPKDLLWQQGFVEAAMREAERVAVAARDIVAVVGLPWREAESGVLRNCLLVMRDGRIQDRYNKRLLPTYDVFDEDRYFTAGHRAVVIEVAGRRVGLAICEDLWRGDDAGFAARYHGKPDPVTELVSAGADFIVSPSASPFVLGKSMAQRDILKRHAARHGVTLASVNQLGGNDDLVFDGQTAIVGMNSAGDPVTIAAGAPFQSEILIHDCADKPVPSRAPIDPLLAASGEALLWKSLTLGVRDYVHKTGFSDVVLGLSGGIDSAVTACIAIGALGAAHVLTVGMPSRYSSEGSVTDAEVLARSAGTKFLLAPIERLHDVAEQEILPHFKTLGLDPRPGVTEENIQSRLRGLMLMALSNKTGALLLTTGNKSELAVGYCTLYGDMNGGLAVLSDVSKTQVFALARWINAHHRECGFKSPPIPESTIEKPPSAELKPDQTDQDSLPPYDELDEIIERYIERRQSPDRIVAETHVAPEVVAKVIRLIDVNEYKRKQTAVGIKVTGVAFGSGRRYPIAQHWRPERSLLE